MKIPRATGVWAVPRFVLCALAGGLALAGCVSGPESYRPTWWENPHQHDADFLYFKAEGKSSEGLEQARQEALKEVKAQVAEYICDQVQVQRDDQALRSAFKSKSVAELRGVEVFDERDWQSMGVSTVWMLGRYPRSEYNRVRQKMALGAQLEHQWREAQSEANRQGWGNAERLLLEVIRSYDQALGVDFALEAAKLELAGVYAKQNRGMKARQWIADVLNSATDEVWRKRAEDLNAKLPVPSVRDAFENKTVGVFCQVRKDGRPAADLALSQDLNARLLKDQVRTVRAPAGLNVGGDLFDSQASRALSGAFVPQGADVVLAVVLDVDSSKTGKKVAIPFSDEKADALDAALRYLVVRVSDGAVLASDSTPGYSANGSYLLTVMLTHPRHLPKYAAQIANGLAAPSAR